jgi:ATP-dependent RNA helicase DDX19/DBP5
VLDWLQKRCFNPKMLKVFCLDEADVMIATQGHQEQSIRIKKQLPQTIQTLLFSATYSEEVKHFAHKLVLNPIELFLKREEETLSNIRQTFVLTPTIEEKYKALANIYATISIGQCMIFCRTRATAYWLAEKMSKEGHQVGLLAGDMDVGMRAQIIDRFREAKEKVLITTNVSARGLDIEQVTVVVNFDLPDLPNGQPDFETYLHRIGRTGRFGRLGIAINMIDNARNIMLLKQIQDHFGTTITQLDVSDPDKIEALLKP